MIAFPLATTEPETLGVSAGVWAAASERDP
jgi:hypothetical protein